MENEVTPASTRTEEEAKMPSAARPGNGVAGRIVAPADWASATRAASKAARAAAARLISFGATAPDHQ